ncbi:MAG: HEAT repeat domain-containing protein [Gemmataceae bacterium]|nr:HEAT repeat domain-containing protein [Gemmataceae bacterium]
MKRSYLGWLGIVLAIGLAVATAVTPAPYIVWGYLRGEAFFDGCPSCYWSHKLGENETRVAAYWELQNGGEAAVPVLMEVFQSDDLLVKRGAASVLGQIGPAAKDAVPTLIPGLKSDDEMTRIGVAATLGNIGPEARSAIPALTETLKDERPGVRKAGAYALNLIDPEAAKRLGVK